MEKKGLCEEKRISKLEKLGIILLAMSPILQHYRGPFVSASVTLLLVMFPFVAIKLLHVGGFKMKRLTLVLPLMLTFIYEVVAHGTTVVELGQAAVFIVFFAAIAAGCLNTGYFVRAITVISAIASICIIVQYICYYVLGFHLQLAPTGLFLERSEQWILLAQTGRVSVTGRPISFYRPSAFFLEPSHMFIYMFTPLALNLLSDKFGKKELRISVLLTIGMIFSTSGMGIAATAGIWLLFLGKNGGKSNRLDIRKYFRPRSVLILLLLIGLVVCLLIWVPFFRNSILRVVSSGSDYKNAVSGRITGGISVLQELTGRHLFFGVADNTYDLTVNMTGFTEEMYKYGIFGTLVSYLFYIQGLFRLKNEYFWVCLIAIVMSFFSQHSHSSFFMLYCAFTFTEGYRRQCSACKQEKWSEGPIPAHLEEAIECSAMNPVLPKK